MTALVDLHTQDLERLVEPRRWQAARRQASPRCGVGVSTSLSRLRRPGRRFELSRLRPRELRPCSAGRSRHTG